MESFGPGRAPGLHRGEYCPRNGTQGTGGIGRGTGRQGCVQGGNAGDNEALSCMVGGAKYLSSVIYGVA